MKKNKIAVINPRTEVTPKLDNLSYQIWDLYTKGYSKTKIATSLQVHRNTVAAHIKKAAQEFLKDNMGSSGIEILTEELAKLSDTESEISRDLMLITQTKGVLFFRNTKGDFEEIPAAVVDAQKTRLYKLKVDIINQRLKILQDCGAMPRTPEAMKKALNDYQADEGAVVLDDMDRSSDQIEADILKLLKNLPTMGS